jgi:hypothetical protein
MGLGQGEGWRRRLLQRTGEPLLIGVAKTNGKQSSSRWVGLGALDPREVLCVTSGSV